MAGACPQTEFQRILATRHHQKQDRCQRRSRLENQSKSGDIAIEEIALGKSTCTAKCALGKSCEFDDNGRRMTAMTYFLDTTPVQMRSASDNSTVVKRQLKMEGDGSMKVQQIAIVPSDKTEVLVFTKKTPAAAGLKLVARE